MREIKFRVWNNVGKRMLYDSSLEIKGNAIVSKFTMQFTGFFDKNKKEIFEGDICKWIEMEGITEIEKRGFVRFDGGRFEIGNHNGYGGDWSDLGVLLHPYWNNKKAQNTFEVIGNIFENKKLLGCEDE